MTALAFGHVLRIKPYSTVDFRFQNFFLGEQMEYDGASYQFVPFGFSGVTVNRTGDGLEATLVFPNNDATRAWAVSAIDDRWLMEVEMLILPDPDPDTGLSAATTSNRVNEYVAQVTSGQWDSVSLNINLSTVLDAVGTDIPRRTLTQKLVGNLPITSAVRLQ